MATQTDQLPRSNKSKANSHNHNSYEIPPEIASTSPIKVTEPHVEPVTDEQHRELVAVAAYYLAERRNFEPGHEAEDWLAAEIQVRRSATRIA
jgi:hypothetical protein